MTPLQIDRDPLGPLLDKELRIQPLAWVLCCHFRHIPTKLEQLHPKPTIGFRHQRYYLSLMALAICSPCSLSHSLCCLPGLRIADRQLSLGDGRGDLDVVEAGGMPLQVAKPGQQTPRCA